MPRKSKRRMTRPGRRNQSQTITSVTPAQEFERKLARSSDACVLRGKFYSTIAPSAGTPVLLYALHPSNLGVRASALANIFTRFRFLSVGFKFSVSTATQAATGGVMGVLDDASGTEGDAPTSTNAVLELRTSALNLPTDTVPTEFMWKPVDRNLWYSTSSAASVSDPRLLFPGVIYVGPIGGAGTTFTVELDWELVFKGASDTGGG